ncbi:hypothetical protein [Neptunomonas japonica]|uniref:hypothetical protein n=1 Tax=Neptunomonas japonica TaxID=417574 RepID=UPI000418B90E|nr:hypothetical protein [Neptunomonas japonica]
MDISGVSNQVPLMDRSKFAEEIGISLGSLNEMIRKGYVPVIRLKNQHGRTKRSLVNLAALRVTCLAEEGES